MSRFVLCLALAAVVPVCATAADLSKIDRTIKKEPAYKGKPKYCLLVFGPNAEKRVWLVFDGDVLYVDKNGDGDLTDPGERIAPLNLPKRKATAYRVGVLELGQAGTYSVVSIVEGTNELVVVQSKYLQSAAPKFAETAHDAPVVHFGGPLTFAPPFQAKCTIERGETIDFRVTVGTAGIGDGTFASVLYIKCKNFFEASLSPEDEEPPTDIVVPVSVHPVVEIEFPGKPHRQARFTLPERC